MLRPFRCGPAGASLARAARPDAAQRGGSNHERADQAVSRQRDFPPAADERPERARDEQRRGQVGGAGAGNLRPGRPSRRGDAPDQGNGRRAVRAAAQGGRRAAHLLQSVDRRLSDLRRARRRARHPADQGHSRRRRGRHGRRLCARFRPDRRRDRRQYRARERHDPDGQQLQGPDSDHGRGR